MAKSITTAITAAQVDAMKTLSQTDAGNLKAAIVFNRRKADAARKVAEFKGVVVISGVRGKSVHDAWKEILTHATPETALKMLTAGLNITGRLCARHEKRIEFPDIKSFVAAVNAQVNPEMKRGALNDALNAKDAAEWREQARAIFAREQGVLMQMFMEQLSAGDNPERLTRLQGAIARVTAFGTTEKAADLDAVVSLFTELAVEDSNPEKAAELEQELPANENEEDANEEDANAEEDSADDASADDEDDTPEEAAKEAEHRAHDAETKAAEIEARRVSAELMNKWRNEEATARDTLKALRANGDEIPSELLAAADAETIALLENV